MEETLVKSNRPTQRDKDIIVHKKLLGYPDPRCNHIGHILGHVMLAREAQKQVDYYLDLIEKDLKKFWNEK